MAGFDPVTLSLAKKYTDSMRLASEEKTSITWNGNTDGLPSCEVGFSYYKVSPCVFTSADLIGSYVAYSADGITQDDKITAEYTVYEEPGKIYITDYYVSAIAGTYNIDGLAVVIPEDGTYFMSAEGAYTESLSKETIHPIDPKFLPGVCLPVVELTTEPTEEGAECTEDETAALEIAAARKAPILLLHNLAPIPSATVCRYFEEGEIASFAGLAYSNTMIQVGKVDGVWFALRVNG